MLIREHLRRIANFLSLIILQQSVVAAEVRLVTFTGTGETVAPNTITPIKNLIIRSNLKGNISFTVKKWAGIKDMKIRVKLEGIQGSNVSNFQVKYRRYPGDKSTLMLEVHEPIQTGPLRKLSKTSIVVIICTISICSFALFCAVSGCIGIFVYRKYQERKHLKGLLSGIESDSDSDDSCDSDDDDNDNGDHNDCNDNDSDDDNDDDSGGDDDDVVQSTHSGNDIEKKVTEDATSNSANDKSARTTLDINNTTSINGSRIGLNTENLRSAHVIKGSIGSEGETSSETEIDKMKNMSGKKRDKTSSRVLRERDFKVLAKESMKLKEDHCSGGHEAGQGNEAPRRRPPRRGGSPRKLPGYQGIFIVSCLACLSLALASPLHLDLLHTATAEVEVDIPGDLFESVFIFINEKHSVPIIIKGDKPTFKTSVFDVDSVSAIVVDKCKGKDPSVCKLGRCDPATGKCVCPRKLVYSESLQKCVQDCSLSCPFEMFSVKKCTLESPAVCQKCRGACPIGQFESTPCGGNSDRSCSAISTLPAVKTSNGILSENRLKVKSANKRIYVRDLNQPSVEILSRGTGIEVVVNVIEANFGVRLGEVTHIGHDTDPSDVKEPFCRHSVPLYYVARRYVLDKLFYYSQEKHGSCTNERLNVRNDSVYCLSLDHDLVRLFTNTMSENTVIEQSEGSVTCEKLMQECLECGMRCSKVSERVECAKQQSRCYLGCKKSECDCKGKTCPCHMYVAEKCGQKLTSCIGVAVNRISLQPVFSPVHSYCHVRVKDLATYKIRTDLYYNNHLITSKIHHAAGNPRKDSTTLSDDYGYMRIMMPDTLRISDQDLLIRKGKHSHDIEVGRFVLPTHGYQGPKTDGLVFIPKKPFSINKNSWKKTKCDKIDIETFQVVGKYPMTKRPPDTFKKISGLFLTRVKSSKGEANNRTKTFLLSKSKVNHLQRFLDINMSRTSSVLRHIFPDSDINPDGLHCQLVNKTSYWSVVIQGKLKSCPGSLTVKLFEQDAGNRLMFHYDFAITKSARCDFHFEFNIPMGSRDKEKDIAYKLLLISSKKTMRFVLLRERQVDRLLPPIVIPEVDKREFLNAIVPISVVAGGLVFLLILLVIFGAMTKPRSSHVVCDSEFHVRHIFVIVWYVGARLAKSILLTFTFVSYILVVIHSNNYHTLKTFDTFQRNERLVFASIFEDMERHRVIEIDRQHRRLVAEKNICEMKLQKLDVYLSKRKREASWQQQLDKKTKSIRLAAITRFEENLNEARSKFDYRKKQLERRFNGHLHQIKSQVDSVKDRVLGHTLAKIAKGAFNAYKFFGGKHNFAGYLGIEVDLSKGIKYVHRIQSLGKEFERFSQNLRAVRENQEKSERLNFKIWEEERKRQPSLPVPKLHTVRFRKEDVEVKFDKDLLQDVLGITWVVDMAKNKLYSKIATILMVVFDALFFVYRHTRTYAMAVLMIHGFKKVYDLDKAEKKRQGEEEEFYIRNYGLEQGYSPEMENDSSDESSDDDEGGSAASQGGNDNDDRKRGGSDNRFKQGLIGEELSTSEQSGKKPTKGNCSDTSSTTSSGNSSNKPPPVPIRHFPAVEGNLRDTTTLPDNNSDKPPPVPIRRFPADKTNNHEVIEEEMNKQTDEDAVSENGEIENGDGQQMVDDELIETSKKTSKGSNSLLSQSKDLDSCKDAKSADEDEPLLNDSPKKSSANKSEASGVKEVVHHVFVTVVGHIGSILLWFVTKMKKVKLINLVLFNTHLILIFFLICFAIVASYFSIITVKYVLQTPVLDELGFFDAKITPIVAYRKVVNTRTTVNAFMINHVHIPYYEARMNARIEMYRLKAGLYKKLQCVRAALYNAELCSWEKDKRFCRRLNSYDEGFYSNLTQFRCHIHATVPRRYSNFDRVQFKNEMLRSYNPYITAVRALILDTFEMILIIIGIQIIVKISSKVIFNILFSYDMIRQVKVYQTKRPIALNAT